MCAIFGIGFMKGCNIGEHIPRIKTVLKTLITQSQPRGRDATGVAFVRKGDTTIAKGPIEGTGFIKTNEFNATADRFIEWAEKDDNLKIHSGAIIGHCRFQTKGSFRINVNNHPIIARRFVGVHNGSISNDEQLFKKFPAMQRNGLVDSEVIFQLMNEYAERSSSTEDTIQQVAASLEGSFACAMTEANNPYAIWLFRNYNPTVIIQFPKSGTIAFASTEIAIRSAFGGFSDIFGKGEIVEMPANSGIGIDLYRGKLFRFAVKDNRTVGQNANLYG